MSRHVTQDFKMLMSHEPWCPTQVHVETNFSFTTREQIQCVTLRTFADWNIRPVSLQKCPFLSVRCWKQQDIPETLAGTP